MLFVTLAFALHTLIHRLVLRRLAALTARTEGVIAECVPDQALEAPDRTTGDEIDLLHQRYEALLSGLTWRDHQRSLAMSELQAAQSLLDDVANALPSALIVLDTNETIAYSNRSARALAAQTGDLTGQPLLAAYPLLEDNQDTIRAVVSSNKPQDVHRRIWQRDKQQMILNLSIYPLSQSAVGGVVIRIDDVTERTRFEEAMIQTEKLSSIGGLAAGVAHEINNPLGVMVQAAQNIERRLSDSLEANHRIAAELGIELATIRNYLEKRSILAFLDDIKADGARAAKIVRNLLEFSRKSEPTRQETALPDLIDCALELARKDYDLKKRFDFRKIEIVLHHDPDLPAIRLIRSEVEQVLLNLLKNAAQAMSAVPEQTGSDGPRITITTRMLAAWAEIEIQDNGPGFSIESRKRAFEPFYTTKAPGEGTGLGLWVSYMIMTDKHQGQMLLESSPGQGACFRLRFPL
jgi:signal transduction histidine kinase